MFTEKQQHSLELLVDECHQWHEKLVSWREELQQLKNELYYFAPGKREPDVAFGIEHFHNQLHIQLINIHNLKHDIKRHLAEMERYPTFGHRVAHRYTRDKVDMLLGNLNQLANEFHIFIKQ